MEVPADVPADVPAEVAVEVVAKDAAEVAANDAVDPDVAVEDEEAGVDGGGHVDVVAGELAGVVTGVVTRVVTGVVDGVGGDGVCERDRDGEPADVDALLDGAGLRPWWCRGRCTPRGGPGSTGGKDGPGPSEPEPGATGTTTPAPAAYTRSTAMTRAM